MKFKRMLCLLTLLCLVVSALPGPMAAAKAETNYTITVDVTNQIVTVYDTGNITDSGIVRQMICSTGKNATPTPLGTYSLPKPHSIERKEWYYFSEFNCYAKWATRVVRGILFHSVLYTAKKKGPTSSSTKALGSKASHGCIRLKVEDAHWVAMNCPEGTTCKIFKGAKNDALRKKVKSKTFSRDEMTYEQFAGGAASPAAKLNLSKGKKGAQVTELQNRLRGLGYMSAAADGKFGNSTRDAVNSFRAAIGLKKTGKVDQALWDRIFAADAPVSTLATLVEGWQGPAVQVLQRALADLKLFSGAVDGNFGADTREAVQNYQNSFNLAVTGTADTALQNDAIARAASVKAQFGDAPYQMVTGTADVTLATMKVKSYTRMRATPSKKGKKLIKLYKSTRVKVLSDDGGAWVPIQAGGVSGYVERKYLNMYAGTENTVSYQPVVETAPEQTPAAEVFIPASEPTPASEVFIPASEPAVAVAAPEMAAEPLPEVALAAPGAETEPEVAVATPEIALAELMADEGAEEAPAEAEAVPAEAEAVPAEAEVAPVEAQVQEPSPEGEATGAPEEGQDEEPSAEETQKPSLPQEGAERSEAEGVASPDETPSTDATQEETTSSVSPDGEPASPEGEAIGKTEEAPAEVQALEPSPEGEAVGEAEAAPAQPLPRYAVTLAEGTALYARPAEDAPVAAQLPANAALAVEGIDGEWIAVRYEQGVAYLRAGDAMLTDAAPEPAPEVNVAPDAAAPAPEPDGEPALEMGTEPDVAPEPAPEENVAPDAAPALEPDGEPAIEMGTEPVVESEPAPEGVDGTGLIFEEEQE